MLKFFCALWKAFLNLFRKPKPNAQPENEQEACEAEDRIMQNIEHVVVVMMENRSFDNVLGWLYTEAEARNLSYIPSTWDGNTRLYDGIYPSTADRYINLYKGKDGGFGTSPVEGASTNDRSGTPYYNSPPIDPWETFYHVTEQLFGQGRGVGPIDPWEKPAMKGFLQNYASKFDKPVVSRKEILQIMEGFSLNPKDGRNGTLPILNKLARHYATSDHWYCSVPSQTNPNRAWMACGTSQGQTINEGPQDQGVFTVPTLWEKMNGSLSWKVYYEEDYFPFEVPHYIPKGKGPWTQNAFPWLQRDDQKANVQEIQSFHRDARLGELPKFSFIEPSWTIEGKKVPEMGNEGIQGNECHPPGDVRTGDQFIGTLYNSLIANKTAWNKTLFIITFDKHGGIFDHIPPPPAPVDQRHLPGDFAFDRYGVRVPTIFISPQIKKQTVFRGPEAPNWDRSKPIVPQLDHTSIPATLLKWAGLKPPYGLFGRTDVAPTFEGVLNIGTNPIRRDYAIGNPNRHTNGTHLTFGDSFYLRFSSHGYDYYLSHSYDSLGTHYALASTDPNKMKKVRFTFPDLGTDDAAKIAGQAITHGSMIYITSEAAPHHLPYLTVDDGDCYYDKDHKNSLNQWVIKLATGDPGDLGQFIYDRNQIYLENRDNIRLTEWLPGKLIVNYSEVASNPYTTTTEDADYADPTKGIITIIKA